MADSVPAFHDADRCIVDDTDADIKWARDVELAIMSQIM